MMDTVIGVKLLDGPTGFAGFGNAYDARAMGGWPPPERLVALLADQGGKMVVAVAPLEKVPASVRMANPFNTDDFVYYVQEAVSELPQPGENFFRGASYKVDHSHDDTRPST